MDSLLQTGETLGICLVNEVKKTLTYSNGLCTIGFTHYYVDNLKQLKRRLRKLRRHIKEHPVFNMRILAAERKCGYSDMSGDSKMIPHNTGIVNWGTGCECTLVVNDVFNGKQKTRFTHSSGIGNYVQIFLPDPMGSWTVPFGKRFRTLAKDYLDKLENSYIPRLVDNNFNSTITKTSLETVVIGAALTSLSWDLVMIIAQYFVPPSMAMLICDMAVMIRDSADVWNRGLTLACKGGHEKLAKLLEKRQKNVVKKV